VTVTINFLADNPELVSTLAEWTYDAWSQYDPELTIERATQSLVRSQNREKIPLSFVALDGARPIGMATLKESIRVPGYQMKTPWLGSFYVQPDYHNQGVGSALLDAIYAKAKKLGYKVVYLFASDASVVPWYEKHGWQRFATDTFYEREVTLMCCHLPD